MRSNKVHLLKQSGNTLMGIIIGLVIGLSIAVVVALVITKASTPFTNKGGKSDKADTPLAQMQDPNKPMYGSKDAVNQAAKEIAASKAALDAANTLKSIEPPVAASSASKPEAVDDKFIYFLQVGAFKDPADAESLRARLAFMGIEASISEKPADANNPSAMHRVRVGPFTGAEAMKKMRAKLSENSIEAAIVQTPK